MIPHGKNSSERNLIQIYKHMPQEFCSELRGQKQTTVRARLTGEEYFGWTHFGAFQVQMREDQMGCVCVCLLI